MRTIIMVKGILVDGDDEFLVTEIEAADAEEAFQLQESWEQSYLFDKVVVEEEKRRD